jgi:hypothetical protein
MAEEAAIDRKDMITQGAIDAPLEPIKNLKLLDSSIDNVINTCDELHKVIANTKSMKVMSESVAKLTQENKNLTKVQDDLFKRVVKAEKENKKLAESIKKLQAETKKQKEETEKLGNAMEALDNRVNGQISRWRQLGKELLMIAKSPIVLMLAALVGVLYLATSAVKAFWSSTGEGEDALDRQKAQWNQFFVVLKERWVDLGKTIQDFFGDGNTGGVVNLAISALQVMFPLLSKWLEGIRADFNKTSKEVDVLTARIDALEDSVTANMTRRARTQTEINKLMLESQDKLQVSEIGSLLRLEEAIRLKQEQLRTDIQIAKTNADIVLLRVGLDHNLTEAQTRRMTMEERLAKFTAEENRKIAESLVKIIELEGSYYQEVKKNEAKIISIKQDMHAKELEMAKKAAQDIVRVAEEAVDQRNEILINQIADVQKQTSARLKDESLHWTQREKIIKDSDELINQMREQARIEDINNQIKAMEVSFRLLEFDSEEQAKIAERLKDLKIQLIDEVYKQSKTLGKTQLELDRENLEKTKELYEEFAGSIGNLMNSMSQNRLDNIDRELEKFEAATALELVMAGDNDDRKKEIEQGADLRRRDLERKRITEMRRAAIFEKATSLIQAGIATALAVAKALPNIPLAVAAGIAGAIQVAAIAAKQIPQYEDGGTTTTRRIIAGEAGEELYKTPSGKVGLTPGVATIMDLPVGTVITPADETQRILAMNQLNSSDSTLGSKSDAGLQSTMERGFNQLNKTIKNKREVHFGISRRGAEIILQKAETRTRFLNDWFK